MQDSNITYKVTAVGIEEATAKMEALGAAVQRLTVNKDGSVTASGKSANAMDNESRSANNNANSVGRASKAHEGYIFHIAKTTVLSALVNKAFLGISDSAGQAVKQVDLFNNFPATMAAMGISTKDSLDAFQTLRGYIAGVGGDLSQAAISVTRFTEVTRNVKAATAEFVGVNNALIAGGAGAEVQKNALEQLTQAYSRGKPQLIEWRSLMVAMPLQLGMVAKAMNLPNANALGEALTKGKVSMQDFVTELTKLSTNGGPIAQQAIARMQGIEFATNIMKNALTNGLAAIYQAIGRQNIIAFFNFLTQVIIVVSQWIVILINDLISLFNIISKVFGGPQIQHFTGEAQGAAGATGDMANNLGDAADNAKDLKKSLASFDKMNVLPDKTSKDSGAGGTGPLDAATAGALDNIFGDIGGKLQTASAAAKVLAGVLAGLAANALVKKMFGVDPLKELIKGIGDAGKGFLGLGKAAEGAGENAGKTWGVKFGEAAGKGVGKLGNVIAGAAGGIASVITETIGPAIGAAFISALAPLGVAIAGFFGVEIAVGLGAALIAFGAIIAVIAAIAAIVWLIWTNWDTIWKLIQEAFNAVVGAIVAVWNTLYDIFAAPIKWIWQFITAIFILIVAIIAIALQTIFQLVVGAFVLIYNVLAAVAGWIYANVITPVVNFFVGMWNGVVAIFTAAWNWIYNNILAPVGGWIYGHVIAPVLGFFQGLWNTVSGFTVGFINSIFGFLAPIGSWIYNNVISPIVRFFQGAWDAVLNGLRGMWNGLQNIFNSLGGIIKAPINGVIDLLNAALRGMNNIKVPDWVPGLGGKGVNFPMIPRLATGGIVNQATMAIIGEQGKEAVMPLENNTGWIDELAAKINSANGRNGGQPIALTVQIGEEKIATKVIELINENTQMSGRNAIVV